MATLIAVYNSDGCVGRCDARCYQAMTSKCDCICGGKNHGAGEDQAIENTRNLAHEWIDAASLACGGELTAEFGQCVEQRSIYDMMPDA